VNKLLKKKMNQLNFVLKISVRNVV